jgi:hypothetical protein
VLETAVRLMRPVVRNILFGSIILGGLAFAAGRRGGEDPAETTAEPPPAPAAPAPVIFSGSLPVAVEQIPEGLANLSSQSCNACHWQSHDDWSASSHADAWRSESYQEALHRVGDSTACTTCHLPLTSQHARLATSYIEGDLTRPTFADNPAWDPTLMSEGVGCVACHVRDGVVLGIHESSGGPHPVVVSEELTQSTFCASCHQLTWPEADKPFYDTFGEWEASPYAAAGIRCQDCHMPPVAAPVTATHFAGTASHRLEAARERAVSVLVSMKSPSIQRGISHPVSMRLQNTGAGHHFPTGSPFKRYLLTAELLGDEGLPLSTPFSHELARVIEDAPPWNTLSDTRLPAGEERALSWEFLVDQRTSAQDAIIRISVQPVGSGDAPTVLQEIPVQVL